MKISSFSNSNAQFTFEQKKGKTLCFRQTKIKGDTKQGSALEVKSNGHDHVTLDFRELYPTASGKQGDKRYAVWSLDTQSAVQLASVLFYMADNVMRDSNESPYKSIVAHKEKAYHGQNFLAEDFETAVERTDRRKSRSYLYGVMQRFVECCTDQELVEMMAVNMATWAEQSGDEFAIQQSEKMLFQLNMVSDACKN